MTVYKRAYLEEAHKYSSNHRKELENDYQCGCFYCQTIFSPVEIKEWLGKEEGDPGGTALCPSCGIDSVIGESSGFEITPMFLNAMYKYWFDPDYSKKEEIEVDDEVYDWGEIKNQEDIDNLMRIFHGFHDSCIAAVHYRSGYCVDKERTMSQHGNHEVNMIFHGQWETRLIELCFENVRKIYIDALKDNYMNEIYAAYLKFHDILIKDSLLGDKTISVIVWKDNDEFDISDLNGKIKDFGTSFVIADSLKWRIIEDL